MRTARRTAVHNTSCHTLRRVLTRHYTLDLNTGAITDTGRSTWSIETCDKPLFSDAERTSGTCRSCASGWSHPENQPLVPVFDAVAHARFSLEHWRRMAAQASTREEHRRAAEGIAVWSARCAELARCPNPIASEPGCTPAP